MTDQHAAAATHKQTLPADLDASSGRTDASISSAPGSHLPNSLFTHFGTTHIDTAYFQTSFLALTAVLAPTVQTKSPLASRFLITAQVT